MEILLKFREIIAALAGAVIGAVISTYLSGKKEKGKQAEEILFSVYMRLLDLHALYFGITTSEFWNKDSLKNRAEIKGLAWKILDDIRKIDHLPICTKVIRLLLENDPEKYPSALSRYEAFEPVVDELGNICNPNYQQLVKQISEKNLILYGSWIDRKILNAPGTFL